MCNVAVISDDKGFWEDACDREECRFSIYSTPEEFIVKCHPVDLLIIDIRRNNTLAVRQILAFLASAHTNKPVMLYAGATGTNKEYRGMKRVILDDETEVLTSQIDSPEADIDLRDHIEMLMLNKALER